MSEVMLDFSQVSGHEPETLPVMKNLVDFDEQNLASGAYVGKHLADDAASIDDSSNVEEFVQNIQTKIKPAIEKLTQEKVNSDKKVRRYQSAAVVLGAATLGSIVSIAAYGGASEPLPIAERNNATVIEETVEVAPVSGVDTPNKQGKTVESLVTTAPKGDREETSVLAEEGLTLSHVAQALAVVRGDQAMKTHYLEQISTMNPEAVESLEIGEAIFLPSDVVHEEALKVLEEIEEGCEVIPKLGADATIAGTMSEVQQKVEELSDKRGRSLESVKKQMLQRNPNLVNGESINFEGEQSVVIPFGSQTVKGEN